MVSGIRRSWERRGSKQADSYILEGAEGDDDNTAYPAARLEKTKLTIYRNSRVLVLQKKIPP